MNDYLEYEKFKKELNKKLTSKEPEQLLKTIISNPYRYISDLRISSLDEKLMQNITQSREIAFGYFIEDIITKYLEIIGYTNLDKIAKDNDDKLAFDQLFKDNDGNIYIVEQKIRDDHDSSKKVGQMENFKRKICYLKNNNDNKLIAIMWFLDDTFKKNINYYNKCIIDLEKDYNVIVKLFYGREFFTYINNPNVWDELLAHIKRYKNDNTEKLKIYDFDNDTTLLDTLINLENKYWNKLIADKYPYNEIRKIFFKNNNNLSKAKEKRTKKDGNK